jgi:hypothetical protein
MSQKSIQSDRIASPRILRAGINSVFAAVVANLVTRILLGAVLGLPAEFPPLQYPAIAFLTILGTSAGAVVFYLISRRARDPIRTYWIVAMAALALSIIPNFFIMTNPSMMPFPGGSALAFGILIVFHLVAGIVSTAVLTRSVLRS